MAQTLERRIEELEKRVSDLLHRTQSSAHVKDLWRTHGAFNGDEEFDEAIRLGREYRKQQTYEKEITGN